MANVKILPIVADGSYADIWWNSLVPTTLGGIERPGVTHKHVEELMMIKRKSWQEVKRWEEWLEEHMTEERIALYRKHSQRDVAYGGYPVANYLAVTSGSDLDWASSGSPLPLDGKIPEMEEIAMIRCWYCSAPNRIHWADCERCGAPLRSEE